jgi:BirA family biotin operon repressor/biotin-[acetyl-CoA-carboxylase] ligase
VLVEKAETGSTNDDARQLALSGAAHGTAVLAARQTKGRGRAGRSWVSPEGGLYLSVVLRPALPPHKWALLPLAVGSAVVGLLRDEGFPVDLKWPNDVLLAGRKAGGILMESRLGPEPFLVVGLGLNLGEAPLPEAAALARSGAPADRRGLAEPLRRRIVEALERLEKEGPGPTLDEVRARCVTLGRRVAWDEGEGTAVDVAEDGTLLVERREGGMARVTVGDVRVRALD